MDTRELYEAVMQLPKSLEMWKENPTRAFVIIPGGGSHEAGDSRLMEASWDCEDVWVAGTRGDPLYELGDVERLIKSDDCVTGEPIIPDELRFQGYAAHTPGQMTWVKEQLLLSPKIDEIVISTARYHVPRCVLTFIKVWGEGDGRKLKILIDPTSDPKRADGGMTSQSVEEELERIALYQEKGDVATAEEFFRFIEQNT